MKIRFPWAKREHSHPEFIFKYIVCAGCGHLIPNGQIGNKMVRICNETRWGKMEWMETYGESCVPDWDIKEIGIDGKVKYYKIIKEQLVEID